MRLTNMHIYIICIYIFIFSYTDVWFAGSAAPSEAVSFANATFCIYPARLKSVKAIVIYLLFIFGFDK
ncbi:hypothetical protein PCHCB_000489800 [Plasmodium chabaudi chabaudi]|uniref:Uncharacterized protein n=1 Tax=Plasmodium chabaudi chabaudi TaxID=31271 RepID=A0A1D3L6E1_PLACU|nr:hypothetical protein PCHCB_000489800 [Plasmodium chabaudi chabaudi]